MTFYTPHPDVVFASLGGGITESVLRTGRVLGNECGDSGVLGRLLLQHAVEVTGVGDMDTRRESVRREEKGHEV